MRGGGLYRGIVNWYFTERELWGCMGYVTGLRVS